MFPTISDLGLKDAVKLNKIHWSQSVNVFRLVHIIFLLNDQASSIKVCPQLKSKFGFNPDNNALRSKSLCWDSLNEATVTFGKVSQSLGN